MLYGVLAALILFCFYVQRQKDRQVDKLLKEQAIERGAWNAERANLIHANDSEREVWAKERTDLNNRIQVPEAAPFMAQEDPQPQHVPFDDDEMFAEAQKETLAQWP